MPLLRKALDEQKRWGGSLGQTLVDLKLVSESELVHVLAQQLAVPVVDIDPLDVPLDVTRARAPRRLPRQHDLVPFAKELVFLDVAMADPTDAVAIHELQTRTRLNIRPYLAGPKAIERALVKYYARGFGRNARRDLSLQVGRGDELELEIADDPVPIEPLSQREEELLALQDRVDELEARVAKLETALAATMKA